MNIINYLKILSEEPSFEQEKVILVDIDDIITDDHDKNNEARAKGIGETDLAVLKAEIEAEGRNVAPIDLTSLPGEKWKGCDGHRRLHVYRELYEETSDPKWKLIRARKVNYKTNIERAESMLKENLPLYSQATATETDIITHVHRMITEEALFGTDYSDVTKGQIAEYIQGLFSPSKRREDWVNNRAQDVYKLLPHVASKYYIPETDKKIKDFFNDSNPFGMFLPKGYSFSKPAPIADSSGQLWFVYCGKQPTWFTQNIRHYSITKGKVGLEDAKIMVLAYDSAIDNTKSGVEPIKNYRQQTFESILDATPEFNTKLSRALVDSVIYLPQILKGKNEEDMKKLYDYSGKIIESSTPPEYHQSEMWQDRLDILLTRKE